jgi:hypothetical protein
MIYKKIACMSFTSISVALFRSKQLGVDPWFQGCCSLFIRAASNKDPPIARQEQ